MGRRPALRSSLPERHTALPRPAGGAELRRLAGRVFAQRLDRAKPLWELWLVDRVGDDHFAIVAKTHHCLVDGISGVDITTVLFDLEREPRTRRRRRAVDAAPRAPRPTRSADALGERAARAAGLVRAAAGAVTHPQKPLGRGGRDRRAGGDHPRGVRGAPRSPLNQRIGPHRRFAWVDVELAKSRRSRTRSAARSTTSCSPRPARSAEFLEHGVDTDADFRAVVPVSVRDESERGALGNRVAAIDAPLPIGSRTRSLASAPCTRR